MDLNGGMVENKLEDLKILNTDFEIPKRKLVLASNAENSMIVQAFVNYFS